MKYNTYLTIKKSIQYPKFGGFNNGHRTQPIQPEFILEKLLLDLETEDPQIPRSTLSYRRSTSVERPLQISSFMQNKANFRKAKMNVNFYSTKDYENERLSRLRENKPNQTQFQKGHLCCSAERCKSANRPTAKSLHLNITLQYNNCQTV